MVSKCDAGLRCERQSLMQICKRLRDRFCRVKRKLRYLTVGCNKTTVVIYKVIILPNIGVSSILYKPYKTRRETCEILCYYNSIKYRFYKRVTQSALTLFNVH